MTSGAQPSVLVIGGGIAGSACAIRLRHHGVSVHVVERAAFPRPKVCGCCLGGAGLQWLERIQLRDRALGLGVPIDHWSASIGNCRVELPLLAGLAISREVLDPLMLAAAAEAGADVTMQCEANVSALDDRKVTITSQPPLRRFFDCVVVASGLRGGGLQRILPWRETPRGPFGISFTAESDSIQPGVISMACQDDGYVGLVKLADGRVDVAAALRSGSDSAAKGSPLDRVQAILHDSMFDPVRLTKLSATMTTPPLRRRRRAGRGRVLAIGDAVGYVEPFTGEGMTWAMQSGIAAADTIAAMVANLATVGELWEDQLTRLMRTNQRTCRVVSAALQISLVRRAAGQTLAVFPGLAKPLLRRLNRI